MPVIKTESMTVRELVQLVKGAGPVPLEAHQLWGATVPADVRLVVMPHAQSYDAEDRVTFRFWDGEDVRVGMSFERQPDLKAREAREQQALAVQLSEAWQKLLSNPEVMDWGPLQQLANEHWAARYGHLWMGSEETREMLGLQPRRPRKTSTVETDPQPGEPIFGAPDAGLSRVPRELEAKPVAVVESFNPATGRLQLTPLQRDAPSTAFVGHLEPQDDSDPAWGEPGDSAGSEVSGPDGWKGRVV
jgi:hypothetical protein